MLREFAKAGLIVLMLTAFAAGAVIMLTFWWAIYCAIADLLREVRKR